MDFLFHFENGMKLGFFFKLPDDSIAISWMAKSETASCGQERYTLPYMLGKVKITCALSKTRTRKLG